MNRLLVLAVGVLSFGLASCSGLNQHCQGELEYQTAKTLPAPTEVKGLTIPDSPSALRIPPAPAKSVPFAREVADQGDEGKKHVECLDVPPQIQPAKAPATPKS